MTALAVSVSTGNPGSVKPISAWFALGGPGRLQRWQLFLYWTSRTESTLSQMLQTWGSGDKFLHRFATLDCIERHNGSLQRLYFQLSLFVVPTYSRTPFQPFFCRRKKVPCHFPRHWNGSPLSFDMLQLSMDELAGRQVQHSICRGLHGAGIEHGVRRLFRGIYWSLVWCMEPNSRCSWSNLLALNPSGPRKERMKWIEMADVYSPKNSEKTKTRCIQLHIVI